MEKPLIEEELVLLQSFTKSPVYGVFCKAVRLQEAQEIGSLMHADNEKEMYRTQGRLAGLAMVRNMPSQLSEKLEQIQENRKEKERLSKKFSNR